MSMESKFSDAELLEIEQEITDNQRKSDFDTKEYPVEVIVDKFQKNLLDSDKAELFIPDYQREYIWDQKKLQNLLSLLF